MKTLTNLVASTLILAGTCCLTFAQENERVSDEGHHVPFAELSTEYSLLRSDGRSMHGWKVAVGFNVNKWLAVAVDSGGNYFAETNIHGRTKEQEHNLVVGPHFAYRNKSKFVPFAYAMPGVVWETAYHDGIGHTNTGFVFEIGGGLDLEVSKKMAIRLFDLTASTAHVDGHTRTKPKFSAGLVFFFGKKK